MMRRIMIRKFVTAALCSVALVGLLFAGGCSEKASGNKLDDPEHKANMEKIHEQFKAKMQEMKNKKAGSSKVFRRP
jgi:hypothetical protein